MSDDIRPAICSECGAQNDLELVREETRKLVGIRSDDTFVFDVEQDDRYYRCNTCGLAQDGLAIVNASKPDGRHDGRAE